MSNNEKIFEQWLIDNNVEYEYQPTIENVAFAKSGKYTADFKVYTRDKSEYVIVEIKGFMTYEAVNKLKYLIAVHPENILYISNDRERLATYVNTRFYRYAILSIKVVYRKWASGKTK